MVVRARAPRRTSLAQFHRRQQERVHDELKVAEQGLRVQNAVTRRVEKMEVRLELDKQHHERVEWVYEQKLKKKLNLVHKKELRDHARLKEKPPADVVDKFGRTFHYIWLKPHDHEGEDDEDEDDEDEDDEGALPPPV